MFHQCDQRIELKLGQFSRKVAQEFAKVVLLQRIIAQKVIDRLGIFVRRSQDL